MRSCAVVAIACAACGFSPMPSEQGSDARGLDARVADAGPPDAPLDAFVAPAIKPIQSVVKPYGTDDDFALKISASAGDVVLAATYASEIGAVTVSDSESLTWTHLNAYSQTGDQANAGCPVVEVQFWYAVIANAVTTTVDLHQDDAEALGMNLVEYAGVSTTSPVDGDVGGPAPAVTATLTTPPLTTSHFDAVVAVFADVNNSGVMMTAGSGWNPRGSDDEFYTLVIDNTPGVAAGTFTPTGAQPTGTDEACWVGAALALRAR